MLDVLLDYVFIKVVVVVVNYCDYKMFVWVYFFGVVDGCDFFGLVVFVGDEVVVILGGLRIGDCVVGV